jgi:hypothetical protein
MSIPTNMQNLLYEPFKVIHEWCFYNDYNIEYSNGSIFLHSLEGNIIMIWMFGKHLYYDRLKINTEKIINQNNLFKRRINYNLIETSIYYSTKITESYIDNDYFCNKCTFKLIIYNPYNQRINITCKHNLCESIMDEIIFN